MKEEMALEGNPAIVKVGCGQCPSNLMINPSPAELPLLKDQVGRGLKCDNCGTVWYLNGMEVRTFVTPEGETVYAIPFWIPTLTKDTPIALQSMMQDTFEEDDNADAASEQEPEKAAVMEDDPGA